jgi:hypothetical protein
MFEGCMANNSKCQFQYLLGFTVKGVVSSCLLEWPFEQFLSILIEK